MNKRKIKDILLSSEHIQRISECNNWIVQGHKGSTVLDYFLDEGFSEFDYVNSQRRKEIIKAYLSNNIEIVLEDLSSFNFNFLYRSIYVKKDALINKASYGLFWSTCSSTTPCVPNPGSSFSEVLLTIKFDESQINWLETVRSRLDPLFGDKEQEIQLKKDVKIKLMNVEYY